MDLVAHLACSRPVLLVVKLTPDEADRRDRGGSV
jgi:hypothetical protein